jgi:hypothetical protein
MSSLTDTVPRAPRAKPRLKNEFPDYYTRLDRMEAEARRDAGL